jgi:dihydrodipicolinate synthase/N-acetylneuraminate lyase
MLELASTAAEEGVELVQLYSLDPGHGMIPTTAELERYYRFILDRLDCPIAISVHTYYRYPVAPTFLANLCRDYAQIEAINIIMPMAYYLEVREALVGLGREVRLYTSIMTFVEGLYADSYGCQAAEPNIIPYAVRRFTNALLTGDTTTASELYVFVYDFARIVQRWAPSTARWLKMGLKVLGLPGSNGVLREPYLLPGDDQLAEMRRAFDRLRVEEVEAECAAVAAPR